MISTIWHSGKGIAMQTGKGKCCQGWGRGGMNRWRQDFYSSENILYLVSPAPGLWTHTGPWPVRNWQHSRKWVAGKRAKFHLYFQPLPITHITTWAQGKELRGPTDSALWWAIKLFHYTPQYSNKRNKVYSKCDGLESLQNHSPTSQSTEKLSSMKSVLGARKLGHHCSIWDHHGGYMSLYICPNT